MRMLGLMLAVVLTGCATTDRVKTFHEAIEEQNGEIRNGVYLNTKGENVAVQTVNARTRIAELENALTDAQRQVEFHKRRAQELELENLQLRARGNYELQREQKQVIGFDKANNPVVTTTVSDQTPKKREE